MADTKLKLLRLDELMLVWDIERASRVLLTQLFALFMQNDGRVDGHALPEEFLFWSVEYSVKVPFST